MNLSEVRPWGGTAKVGLVVFWVDDLFSKRWRRYFENFTHFGLNLNCLDSLPKLIHHNPSVIFFSYIFFYNDFWAKEKLVDFLWRKNLIRIFGMPKCRH